MLAALAAVCLVLAVCFGAGAAFLLLDVLPATMPESGLLPVWILLAAGPGCVLAGLTAGAGALHRLARSAHRSSGSDGLAWGAAELRGRRAAFRGIEEQLYQMLDELPVLLAAVDESGRVVFWNRQCERVTGYSACTMGEADDFLGLLHPGAGEYTRARETFLAGDFAGREFTLTAHDGAQHVIAWTNISGRCAVPGWHRWYLGLEVTEHRRQNKEQHRLLELSGGMILVARLNGRIEHLNPQWEQTLGISVEAMAERPFLDFVHPDDRASTEAEMARLGAGHRTSGFANRYRTADGDYRWLMWTAIPDTAEGRVYALAQDITSQKSAEIDLQWELSVNAVSARLARKLLSTSDGLSTISELVLEEASRFTQSAFGFVGYIDPATGHLVAPTMTRDIWEQCQVPDKSIVFEKFGGLWGWVLKHRAPVLANAPREDPRSTGVPAGHLPVDRFLGVPALYGEELVGMIAVANASRDYTARDQQMLEGFATLYAIAVQQERSRREQKLLSTVFEQAAEGIIITNAAGEIEFVNPAFERVTGYEAGEIIGQNPRILKSEEQSEAFYRNMWATIARGEVWRGRLVNRTKSGAPYTKEMVISPVFDPDGTITHYVAVSRDVTLEANLEAQLRQAQKMEAIGTLAGGIAHDFNNILGAILGFAELACEEGDEEQTAVCVEEILKGANRATELVQQILAFSRQSEEERQPLYCQLVAEEALRLLRGSLPSTITIERHIERDCGPVFGNATQLHQVLVNLGTNAYHAMRATGGTLTVTVDEVQVQRPLQRGSTTLPPGQYVRLSVADTGQGMDEATLERIFDPYFTTKARGEGTGLGLATVHGIVAAHGGAVFAKSQPGRGARFDIYLPRYFREAEAAPPAPPGKVRGRGERVLFIDDEEALARLAPVALRRLGYEVTSTTSSAEALERFRQHPDDFDVVVTDQVMPNLTGTDLATAMLEVRPELPIILCTGFSEGIDEDTAQSAGIRAYLRKPVVASTLSEAIQQALSRASGSGQEGE